MSRFPGPLPFQAPSLGPWQEHKTPDGRAYFYNSLTKVTQWTKPEEMMSPAERALANQPWKEFTAEGGRKYWHNTETKQSVWEMPEVYKNALGAAATPMVPTGPSDPNRSGRFPGNGYDDSRDRDQGDRDHVPASRQLTWTLDTGKNFVAESNEPDYASFEEAEAAFVKLLRRSGVQPDWTWERTIRATAKDPQFRAIKDPKDKRAAFERFCRDTLVQDKERAKERHAKLRADYETMLKRHPEIKHYTRWKTARPIIEGETLFRATDDEAEREQLFREYVAGLQDAHTEKQSSLHKSAVGGLGDLLQRLNLEPYTRWTDAQAAVTASPPFQNEEMYQTLSKLDVLMAFQNHMKALERSFNDSKQQQKNAKYRKERIARDQFVDLLKQLRKDGKINAGTKWRAIFPLVEKDERYLAMLGNPGSSPMELFWDIIEEEERGLRGPRNSVHDVLEDKQFDVIPKTTFQEFLAVVKDDRRTANIDNVTLTLIFERLQEKRTRRPEDARQQRHAMDKLRDLMRHLEPPIVVTDSYDQVKARIAKSDEFEAVASEESRRAVFDKVIRRLKEKEEDLERDRNRRRDRHSVDRDSHRERDLSRGERSYRSGGRGTRRSRSPAAAPRPEPDAYEVERRKAIAERERNHRKTTLAEGLLDRRASTPPPPRRGDRDRDRDRDRISRGDRDRDLDRIRDYRDRDYDRDRLRDRERDHHDRDRDRDRDRERERDRDLLRLRDKDRDRDRDMYRDRDRLRERERDRDFDRDRDRDYDRPPRCRGDDDGFYDRERRDREDERERIFRRRIDRSGSLDELPYGDGPVPTRRSRPEDDDGRRDSGDAKRVKRDASPKSQPTTRAGTKSPTSASHPQSAKAGIDKDTDTTTGGTKTGGQGADSNDKETHSGSEEGEIDDK